jgi:hypothetical protein
MAGGRWSKSMSHAGSAFGGGCHGEQTGAAGCISLADMEPTITVWQIRATATAVNVFTGKQRDIDHPKSNGYWEHDPGNTTAARALPPENERLIGRAKSLLGACFS